MRNRLWVTEPLIKTFNLHIFTLRNKKKLKYTSMKGKEGEIIIWYGMKLRVPSHEA